MKRVRGYRARGDKKTREKVIEKGIEINDTLKINQEYSKPRTFSQIASKPGSLSRSQWSTDAFQLSAQLPLTHA